MAVNIESYPRFEGIYEVPEAARYISATTTILAPPLRHIRSRNLLRWIRIGLSSPDLVTIPGRELLITFEDLISMRIIALLRAAGMSFKKIRDAEKTLRQITGYPRPFATEEIWTAHSHIFAEFRDYIYAASKSGQIAMDFVREDLIPVHGLTFSRQVASSWSPYTDIRLVPNIQFGRPCIDGTRIPSKSLMGMVQAGDSIEFIADSYRMDVEKVKHAIEWEQRLIAT